MSVSCAGTRIGEGFTSSNKRVKNGRKGEPVGDADMYTIGVDSSARHVLPSESCLRTVMSGPGSRNTSFPSKNYLKQKVKLALEQATKAQRWSRGIALLFL